MERDPNNQESTQDSSEPSQDSASQQESQQETTQQTQNQQVPPTETSEQRYMKLLEATLREQNQRIQSMQSAPTPQAPAPPPPIESDPNAFFTNPQGELEKFRKQINDDLQKTVQPLLELAKGLRGEGTPYGNLKNQFLADPRYSTVLADPKVAFAVDKIMENQQATPDAMRVAIIQAAGLKMTGDLDIALVSQGVDITRFQPSPPTQSAVSTIPPHMRPTNPTPIQMSQTNGNNKVPLTELEKRLAREKNLSDDDFRDWMNAKPNEVATSQIGRPKK